MRKKPKKSSASRRRPAPQPRGLRYASMSRAALLKEYKRLRPRTPKAALEKLKALPRETLLGRVMMAARPKKNPYAKLEGMSRRQLIDYLKSKRGGKGKRKKGGGKKGGLAKAMQYLPGTRHQIQEARWSAEEAEAREAERYNDRSGRRPKKGGKKRPLSAWQKFIKANSHKAAFRYRNGKLNLKKMGVAYRAAKKPAKRTAKKPAKRTAKKRSARRDYGWY